MNPNISPDIETLATIETGAVVANLPNVAKLPAGLRTYAILGDVVSGLDVVDEIAAVERDGGDRPIDPVSIVTATSGPSAP